jgi:hypothetical protein
MQVLRITFIKKCLPAAAAVLGGVVDNTGLGGMYMPGFNVCTSKDCDEGTIVVKNGFPTAKW